MVSAPPRSSATPWQQTTAGLGLALVLFAPGCDAWPWLTEDKWERPILADPEPLLPSTTPAPAEPEKSAAPVVPQVDVFEPLERARKRLPFPLKSATHQGFNLTTLEGLRALAAGVEIPPWAAKSDDSVRALRDGDLASDWHCQPAGKDSPCAVGLHLGEVSEVKAIRLFAAAIGKSYADHPRIAKLRVHTDDGYADTELHDGPILTYVIFGKPAKTKSLILEVLSTQGGRSNRPLVISDVEVFATDGAPREPIAIAPERVVVSTPGTPWTRVRDRWRRGPTFLAELDDQGVAHPLLPGTALYGAPSDTMLLVESMDATDCRRHLGGYFLLDRTSRVLAPVGDFGGLGGEVFGSTLGLGFVGGYVDDVVADLAGVVRDEGGYKHRHTQRFDGPQGPEALVQWAMDPVPMTRGGSPLQRPPAGCELGSPASLARVTLATAATELPPAEQWTVCRLGDHAQLHVTHGGPCGNAWTLVLLGPGGALTAQQTGKRRGSHARLRRLGPAELLIELGGDDDQTALWRATVDGLHPLADGLSLAAWPPSRCRQRCDAPFANPVAPHRGKAYR